MAIRIPALPMTGAQIRGVLLALDGTSEAGVAVPELPFTGQQLRDCLEALEATIGSGAALPALPLSGEQIRAVLIALADAVGPLRVIELAHGGTILTGAIAPSDAVGRNGDLYLRLAAGLVHFYGPKANGSWGHAFTTVPRGQTAQLLPFLAAGLGSVA
jgi:hypothetical protein